MRCDICKFWKPPNERTDFRQAVNPNFGFVEGEKRKTSKEMLDEADEIDRQMGECSGVPENPEVRQMKRPYAATRDASDYMAVLYTGPDFFCAYWENKNDPVSEVQQPNQEPSMG